MRVTYDERDLADLSYLTRQCTLKDMNSKAVMEIEQADGKILNKISKLPDMILNSISTEL